MIGELTKLSSRLQEGQGELTARLDRIITLLEALVDTQGDVPEPLPLRGAVAKLAATAEAGA